MAIIHYFDELNTLFPFSAISSRAVIFYLRIVIFYVTMLRTLSISTSFKAFVSSKISLIFEYCYSRLFMLLNIYFCILYKLFCAFVIYSFIILIPSFYPAYANLILFSWYWLVSSLSIPNLSKSKHIYLSLQTFSSIFFVIVLVSSISFS